MSKTLNVKSLEDSKNKISDIEVFGNPDVWKLLCKASSVNEGWMKSTKVMELANGKGCLVQVSTQQGDNIDEALVFVPDVTLNDFYF